MTDKEKIEITQPEFLKAVEHHFQFVNYRKAAFEKLSKAKFGFTAFIGVIFSVVFNKPEDFSERFLVSLTIIMAASFILFLNDIFWEIREVKNDENESQKRVFLKKIRDITAKEKDPKKTKGFQIYAHNAEIALTEGSGIQQKMEKGVPLDKILEISNSHLWKIDLALWFILYLSIPALFLMKLFCAI